MDSFEYDGIFWPADNPAHKVAGRLSYNPAEGAVLDLIGSIDEPAAAMNVDGPLRRINGVAGAKELTLDGAIPRGARLDGPGLLRQEYYVPVVLSGNHFTVQDSLDFDSVTLQFDQLPFWINKSHFTVAVDTAVPNNFSTATKITIASEVPSVETESANDVDLELSSVSSVDGDRITVMRVGRIPCLSLSYKERRPLLEIITDINGLQDLITLAMDVPSVPTVIQLRRSDITVKTGSGGETKIPVEAYWANIAEYVRRAAPSNTARFFSFDQIDGLAALAKWITVSRKYRLVLGLLLSIRYSQRLYEENRFTNVISAAETFHRMRFDNVMRPPAEFKSYKRKIAKVVKIALGAASRDWINRQLEHSNEPRLRERLIEAARYAGPGFAQFVGQVETWASIVTLLRNRLTHHEPSQRIERSPGDLNALTESLYIMTMLALMRECELPDDVFEGFQASKRIIAIREELVEITPRLAQYLRR